MEHNPVIALFLALAVIIAAARIGGALARLFGQPRVLGELIVGVILGPTLLDMLHWPILHGVPLEETIKELAELGVLFLMFIIGLEVNIGELAKVGRVAIIAGILGALVPVALAVPVLALFGYEWQPGLFAGVTLAATSVSISAQVLLELGHLRSKVGNALLATALIDDVLAILLVSLTVAVVAGSSAETGGDAGSLVLIVVRMAAFIVIAFLLSWFALPRFMNWLSRQPSLAQSAGVPATALIFMLLFGWAAEELGGVATITGAFIVGVGLSRTREHIRHDIEEAATAIAYAFLTPIFFVDIGLETDLRVFPLSALPLALTLLIIALLSKVIGSGGGALVGGFNRRESLQLGVCMISRGEVGLIIASLGVSAQIFTPEQPLFASLFLVILLTTLVTPVLVRLVFAQPDSSDNSENKISEAAT